MKPVIIRGILRAFSDGTWIVVSDEALAKKYELNLPGCLTVEVIIPEQANPMNRKNPLLSKQRVMYPDGTSRKLTQAERETYGDVNIQILEPEGGKNEKM